MQLLLGKRGDYAIRSVLDIATYHGVTRRKKREIAEAMPEQYLARILAGLVQAGVLRATAGRNGGYGLAREPGAITLLDVMEAVEGRTEPRSCLLRGSPCAAGGSCAVHEAWVAVEQLMHDRLHEATFADLVAHDTSRRSQPSLTPSTSSSWRTSAVGISSPCASSGTAAPCPARGWISRYRRCVGAGCATPPERDLRDRAGPTPRDGTPA